MSRGGARRRFRVRRKRRETGGDVADGAVEFGCCLFEVVASAALLAGVVSVPVYLLS